MCHGMQGGKAGEDKVCVREGGTKISAPGCGIEE